MNQNPQNFSALSLAVSIILSEQLSANELNTLGLFLSVVGDILQLNSWQMLEQDAENISDIKNKL